MFYLFIFALALKAVVGFLTSSNKKDNANSADSINQDSIPKARILDPKGVVFGTVLIKDAQTITSGNFGSSVETSGSGGKK